MSTATDLQNDLQQATKQSEIDFMKVAREPDVLCSLFSTVELYLHLQPVLTPEA